MHWVIQFFVRHRILTSLILVVGTSLWMLAAAPTRQLAIARTLAITVFYPIDVTVGQARRAMGIFAENHRLVARLADVNTRLALLEESAAELARLHALLGFKEQSAYDLVPARVVARDPGHVFRSVVVDGGANRSFVKYLPLVNGEGLIGRVVQVMPQLSLVQLLRDPGARASVMTRRGRVVGILQSDNGMDLFVRYRADDTVYDADTVVTSGLGGTYPKGLLVGSVTGTQDDDDPLFRRARVRPFVDFNRVEEAFIMRLTPQWAAFSSELDSLAYEP
jgi:rod shape-determining protein MreC